MLSYLYSIKLCFVINHASHPWFTVIFADLLKCGLQAILFP